MRGRIFAVLLIAMITGCVAVSETPRKQFAGGSIALPRYYELQEEHNLDTPAKTGALLSRKKNLRIGYSIFGFGNAFAEPKSLTKNNYIVVWSRHSGKNNFYKITSLARDRILKEQKLYISFPNGGPANFVATVNSKADISEIEKIVGTFEPSSKHENWPLQPPH